MIYTIKLESYGFIYENEVMSHSVSLSRREILHQLGVCALSGSVLSSAPISLGPKFSGKHPEKLHTFLKNAPLDKIDVKSNYLLHWLEHETQWHSMIDTFISEVFLSLKIPQGWIVEVGTYKARTFNKFCQLFGPYRCLGFESYPYVKHPSVVLTDIRSIGSEFDRPVAFGWSNASSWGKSPRSKLAALRYLSRNIVMNGYLLEDHISDIPHDIKLLGFKVIWQNNNVMLLQKVA